MADESFDAICVGAGFAGIHMSYRLRELGLKFLVIDQAGDVGGTWFWNLYPGAMSDSESFIYRFSWDRDDLMNYPWKDHYVKQDEVLAYLNHVVKKHDLRKYMQFNTQLVSANWSESDQRWVLKISGPEGEKTISTRYAITALGLLSKTNLPDIPGLKSFEGEMYHTGAWPKGTDVTGKRVAVIGCGSTGVQVITEIGSKVGHLTCYQRHPQYSVPSGDRAVTAEERQHWNENWDNIFDLVKNSITAMGFKESQRSFHDATPEEREKIFQEAWNKGNGFKFMFGTFSDIAVDWEANEAAADFIRRQIDKIVKDPEKARKLKPHDVYARRPLCDGNARSGESYFDQFNRDNVDIVDLKETPFKQVEAKGIRTSDGKFTELDCLILATGFDAVDGNYLRLAIHGRNGVSLKEYWDETGPTSYLGVAVPEFPNWFMISGPKGPFTNAPPQIERQVEFISAAIEDNEKAGARVPIEATHEAERAYSAYCEELAAHSLFWKAEDNWIFGANIPGKPKQLRFFFGGMQAYRQKLVEVVSKGYDGFKPFTSNPTARVF
ncbi:hypothetical protein BDY17DRAFT_322366 [Neohortaea acidophila]|uniref:Cyclohexanone monooxygenase n=1 Tax=Neohortaea acidophila TaxID=245834 RepID=A0A6A6PZT5_9PEZI|nr:uncharacterized protein BDY17DRAFT_322366 [Neohortaea acidophila]KAF2485532.1 hypothetical protein BDY17DRAFT_322366 [Neohortaea acidophila]